MGKFNPPIDLKASSAMLSAEFRHDLAKIVGCDESDIIFKVLANSNNSWTIIADRVMEDNIAYSYIVEMPGCCGVCISTAASVSANYRGRGIGTLMNKIRMRFANSRGYSIMMCTDVMDNTAQQVVLKKNGWEHIASFINERTGNDIGIHIVSLRKESKLVVKGTLSFAKHSFFTNRHIQRERKARRKERYTE